MAPASRRGEVAILRPLLGVPRARLAATLKDLGQDWIDDPSNQDAGVERVRLRAAADQLAALGLDASAVAGSARKLARAAGALAEIAAGHGRACVRLEPAGFALIDRAGFLVAPEEIRLRVLRDVLVRVGGGAAPRDGALERAVGELTAEEPAALALARCRVLAHGRRSWLVVRELRDQRPVRLRGGESVVWDGRFAVTLGAGLVEGAIDLRPLGEPAFGSLRRRAGHLAAVPQLAGAALPGGFDGEALVLAPVFGREEGLNVRFLGMEPAGAANSPSS
jgi:tRNA(Ile)-lysidine synthase